MIRIAGNGLLLLGIFVVLLLEDWRLGALVAACMLLGVPVLLRLRRVAVPAFKAHRAGFADLSGFWEEHIAGAEDLRTLGALPYTMQRHWGLLATHMHNARRSQVMGRVMQSCAEALLAIGSAAAIALGAYLLSSGGLTLGTLYLVLAYTGLVATNLLQITMQLDDFQKASGAVECIDELLTIPDPLSSAAVATLPPATPRLSCEQVSFAYEAAPVLHDVSFVLEPGTVLGLLGRTGSGKSTLARLLLRFYDPQAGSIRWNGVDLRTVQLGELRGRLGVVTQEVQLFHATVRDNLTLFDAGIGDAEIEQAIAALGLGAWLQALPHGLDTMLAGGESGLSAGEAQLLAFTRVFLRDPALVILDEASSRLDPATEQLLGRAVERLLRGRTAILIAHRLRTIERVDQILILENGRVVEHGPRAALAADPDSRLAALLRTGREEVPA